jgi:hypothetical protein
MHNRRTRSAKKGARKMPTSMPSGETARVGPLYVRAVKNIERMMGELGVGEREGLSQKEVALGAGMSETVFSSKKRGQRSHFYEDEFEAIANFFRKQTGRPLIGFPHLDWTLMESCDRKVAGWRP